MRAISLVSATLLLTPVAVSAHTGHLAEVAGHDHWIAGAALGAAIAITAWAALKGRRKTDSKADDAADSAADEGDTPDRQEA